MGVDRIVDAIRGWLLPELAAEALDQLLVDAPRAVLARGNRRSVVVSNA